MKYAGEWKWMPVVVDEESVAQANALLLNGWTFVLPELLYEWRIQQSPVMSWFWRAPAKPGKRRGRLYRSTNQAHNAMLKCKQNDANQSK